MKKKFFVVAALIYSSHLQAQDSLSTAALDEVIVTANKSSQKQSTTGKVISIISKTQIEKSGARTLGQLLNEQAGITINGSLNNLGSNQTLYMRGAGQGRTLVLVDGVPVYDPSLITSEFDLNLISLNDVERVEICKGAQSTLYGSDAIAGVINIITINNNLKKPINIKAGFSFGNYGARRANAQVYGKKDKLEYYLRYSSLSNRGFSSAYDSTGRNNFDNDAYKGRAASAGIRYEFMKGLSARGYIQYSRYKNDLDATAFTDEKDQTVSNKNLLTGAEISYQKNKLILFGRYQFGTIARNYFNDSLDIPGFTKFSTDDYSGRTQFAEFYSKFNVGKTISLIQGVDYRYSSMNSAFLSLSSFGPFTSEFSDTSHQQASVYASAIYQSTNERLSIEMGGRFNNHSRYGNNLTFTFNPSYKINEQFRVFGSIASAFKAPSLYQLYSAYGNGELKPEYSTNYEVGIQQTHRKIRNRVVYFHRDIRDGLDFDNLNFQYYNFYQQDVRGIELESVLQPVKNLTISLNYTHLAFSEKSQSRTSFKDTAYNYLLRRPAHSANIIIGYQVLPSLFVSTTGKYVSKRYDTGGYQQADLLLNDYFIVNAYAEYKFLSGCRLFIDVQNCFNHTFFDVRGYNSIPFLIQSGFSFNW